MGTGAAGAAKCTGTGTVMGGGARTGAAVAAKRTGTGAAVGGRPRTGTGAGAGMYMSSCGSMWTLLAPVASSATIVLGD